MLPWCSLCANVLALASLLPRGTLGTDGVWKMEYPPWDEASSLPELVIPIVVPLTRHGCGPSRYMSMRIATSHVNSRDATVAPAIASIRNNFQVKYEVMDTQSNGIGTLDAIIKLQARLNGTLKVVLGPNGSGSSRASSTFLSVFGVPQISWASTSASLSNKATYPNYFRVVSPDSLRMKVLVKFIISLGLRQVNIAYFDDAYTTGEKDDILTAASQLNAEDPSLGFQVVKALKIPSSGEGGAAVSAENLPELLSTLDELKRSLNRVIIGLAMNEASYMLWYEAQQKGMIEAGYLWLGSDGASGNQLNGDVARLPPFRGTLFIQTSNKGPGFSTFVDLWEQHMPATETPEFDTFTNVCAGGTKCSDQVPPAGEFKGWVPGLHNMELSCTGYTSLAYDAMLTLVLVADSLLTEKGIADPAELTSEDWMEGMKKLPAWTDSFQGLSGEVSFNANQERDMPMSILNWQGGSLAATTVVGWSGLRGFEWAVGEVVVWPGIPDGVSVTEATEAPFPAGVQMGRPPPCQNGEIFSVSTGACVPCAKGSYAPAPVADEIVTSCVLCSGGTYADEEGLTECSKCDPGAASEAGSAGCTACSPGRASGQRGAAECLPCGGGTYAGDAGMTECLTCDAGHVSAAGSVNCTACLPGHASGERGSAVCSPCKAGSFASRRGQSECSLCGRGEYVEDVAQTECLRCQSLLASSTTELLGAGDRSLCVCPEDTFRPGGGATSCAPCPEGMVCEIGSDMEHFETAKASGFAHLGQDLRYPTLMVKYWSDPDEPLSVFRCASEDRCVGGADWSQLCGRGARGRSCAECETGWSSDGHVCVECTSLETSLVLFPMMPVVLMPAVVTFMYFMFRDMPNKWGSWRNGLSALGFLTLNHYQVLSLLTAVPVQLPGTISTAWRVFSFSQDVISLFNPACAGASGFAGTLVAQSLVPVVLLLFTVLTWAASHAVSKLAFPGVAMERDRVVNVYLSIIFAFFVGIASSSMALLKCQDNPNDKRTLALDLSVICGDDDWSSMLVVAILCIIVYCIGFGALFSYIIYTAPNSFQSGVFQKRWKFLFIKWRAQVFWWSICILAKGIILNVGLVAIRSAPGQLYWLLFASMIYLMGIIIAFPWRHRVANIFDAVINMSIIALASLTSWFADKAEGVDKDLGNFTLFVSCLPFIVVAILGGILIYTGRKQESHMMSEGDNVMDDRIENLKSAIQAMYHLRDRDWKSLWWNLEEFDRDCLGSACKLINVELNRHSGGRLCSGSSYELGKVASERQQSVGVSMVEI